MRHIPADVLQTFPSSKDPDQLWEVRKSHYDGKVYCTCPGWIFKARKTDGICKHIQKYLDSLKTRQPGATIAVYSMAEYEKVLEAYRELPEQLKVKKNKGDLDINLRGNL